jgi:hypothetical protein
MLSHCISIISVHLTPLCIGSYVMHLEIYDVTIHYVYDLKLYISYLYKRADAVYLVHLVFG